MRVLYSYYLQAGNTGPGSRRCSPAMGSGRNASLDHILIGKPTVRRHRVGFLGGSLNSLVGQTDWLGSRIGLCGGGAVVAMRRRVRKGLPTGASGNLVGLTSEVEA